MKGNKLCFGLLLLFSIMVGLSLNVCSDVSATLHEVVSVPYFSTALPTPVFNSSTSKYELDWSSSSYVYLGSNFSIKFEGSSYNPTINPSSLKASSSYIIPDFSDGYSYNSLKSIFYRRSDSASSEIGLNSPSYFPTDFTNLTTQAEFYTRSPFHIDSKPSFNNTASGLMSCDPFTNGAVCPGLWNTHEYITSQILPYWYTADGFYTSNQATGSDGFTYNYSFNFSDLFDRPASLLSYISLPVTTYDDYWYDSSNFFNGRAIEFRGIFSFSAPYELNQDFLSYGSVNIYYVALSATDGQVKNGSFSCNLYQTSAESGSGSSYNLLEYSCPYNLTDDYLAFHASIVINGNHESVWTTDGSWSFASRYVITDNDRTPGEIFGDNLTGGGDGCNIVGSDCWILNNYDNSSDADWFESLKNMFTFQMLNPFSPIFSLFSNSDSCADIPIIAGMLHSEETRVCSWFSPNVRSILTPVFGLSAMMLVFGFAVRWLGSSSGNFFEDSRNEEVSNQGGRWGHFKKGKQ